MASFSVPRSKGLFKIADACDKGVVFSDDF